VRPDPLRELQEKLLGTWTGASPEHPTLINFIEIFPDRIRYAGKESKSGKGGEMMLTRAGARLAGKDLILTVSGPGGKTNDWQITFESDDVLRLQTPSGPPRVLKRVPKEEGK
jgi:hypothetical protein